MKISRTRLARYNEGGECPHCGTPGDESVFVVETQRETLVIECDRCGGSSTEYVVADFDGSVLAELDDSIVELTPSGDVLVDGRVLSDVPGIDVFHPTA